MINKAFKYRIYPTDEQKILMAKTFGCARFVYNYYLSQWNDLYEKTGDGLSYSLCSKKMTALKNELLWLKEVDSTALQSSLKNLAAAFKSFFEGRNDHPVFHSKKSHASYTCRNNSGSIRLLDEKHLLFPKIGKVKHANSRKPEGRILSATVSRKPSGSYYVSLLCECEEEKLPSSDRSIGIDLGIKSFASFSDRFDYPDLVIDNRYYKRYEKEQCKLSHKITSNIDHYEEGIGKDGKKYKYPVYKKDLKECKNIQKQRRKVAKAAEKIVNIRKDYEHKLSTVLIRSFGTILLEDLDVKGLLEKNDTSLSRSIQERSWSEFVSMLKYKAAWYGRNIIQVDRFFPSSQICSNCGSVKKISLSQRTYTCEECGLVIDRDRNAAINILNEGLRIQKAAVAA